MKKTIVSLVLAALVLGFASGSASAQSFSGQWASPTNGVLSATQNGTTFTATMTGNNSEWWGPMKNRGGTITGTINGRTMVGMAYDGVGNVSNVTLTLSPDGRTLNGTFRVTAGPLSGATGQSFAFRIAEAAPAQPAKLVWHESESSNVGTYFGTWTWDANRKEFVGNWNNGAQAILTVVSDDGNTVILRRYDPAGVSASMSAEYVGQRQGNSIRGTVTWYWKGGSNTGTWSASW